MRDGEAVSLVAQSLDEMQSLAVPVEQDALAFVRQHDFVQPLGKAKHGNVQPLRVHGLLREPHLLRAAVNQNQIGQVGELPAARIEPLLLPLRLFRKAVGQPARDHLLHRLEIVRPLDVADAIVPVFPARAHAVDHHDLAGHGQNALRVRNIVALDAPGRVGQAEHRLKLLQRADCALAAAGALFLDLRGFVAQVLARHLHQLRLVAALRAADVHAPVDDLAQQLLQHRALRQRRADQHLRRGRVFGGIVLRHEARQHLSRLVVRRAAEREHFRGNQPPAAREHHLHQHVRVHGQLRDNVPVLAAHVQRLLPLHQVVHGADAVAVHGGALVVHRRGGFRHARLELL